MTLAPTALLAALLLTASASAGAQDAAGSVANGTAAEAETPPRPKRGGLFDVIKTILPPLIDAATTRPAPAPADPVIVPAPVPTEPTLLPATGATAPARPSAVIAPVSPPRPARADPKPLAPESPAPRSAMPGVVPVPPVPRPSFDTAPSAPPPPAPAPAIAEAVPSPAPDAASDLPPVEPPLLTRRWGAATYLLLGLLAAAAVAGAMRLRRMRRIAVTRSALALTPRLDPAVGTCSTSGLELTGPRLAIRARLAPAGHG